ncbi:UDP-Glycosyltransferase/glycogen phosphorylase [Gigaspora margarita]|uniref:UDP-Glycosyltransferase/glycogen phosphorylase n=1 Tax=Gigaspora margarita TaxID=4874 RepID=A0A8H4EVF8_GIGMA|nr:UDP-Glycosyltransferase/glycogen phosphorylase [Gigaspora margarita]
MYSKLWYLAIFIILFININLVTGTHGTENNNEFIQRELDIDKSDTPKKILVGSIIGGGSHLNPMLEICRILMDRGYNVTLVAPGNFTATSTLYHSIPQIITDMRKDEYVPPEVRELYFNEYNIKNYAKVVGMFTYGYPKFFNDYLQAYKEIKPDLFFCDYIVNEACFDLAWKLKKPVVGYTSGTTYFTPPPPIRSDPMGMGSCHVSMENQSFYNRFICAVVQPLRVIWTFRGLLNDINAKRAEVGVNKYHDFRGRTNTLFLLDNFFGFEVPTAWPPLHQEIGPILPDTFPNLSPELDLFLSTHPRTMYIALGSNMFTTSENYATLLQSALELINQNILDGVIWATVKFNESELPITFNLSNDDIIPISNLINNQHPHFYIMNSRNENGELEVDIETLLRSWVTPASRMGFIRGNYLDVFGVALIIALVLSICLGYGFYKAALFGFRKWSLRNRESQQSLSKTKNE